MTACAGSQLKHLAPFLGQYQTGSGACLLWDFKEGATHTLDYIEPHIAPGASRRRRPSAWMRLRARSAWHAHSCSGRFWSSLLALRAMHDAAVI